MIKLNKPLSYYCIRTNELLDLLNHKYKVVMFELDSLTYLIINLENGKKYYLKQVDFQKIYNEEDNKYYDVFSYSEVENIIYIKPNESKGD